MPRKSKKGGGGSQTEEERLLLQQRRAQTEEEVTRQREEMLTLFLKDKLQRDQRNAGVNLLKINDQWRTILRQTRGAELRGEVTVLSQRFEGHVDVLDNIIETLVGELLEAERQSAQVRRGHLQKMDGLRTQQEKQLELLQQLWDRNMQELISGFSHDKKVQMEERLQHQQQLQDAAFGAQTQHEAAIDETAALYHKLMASYAAPHHRSMPDGSPSNEDLRRQEDEKLCSCEKKHLEEVMASNKQLVQATNEEMKQAKRLQEKLLRLKQKMGCEQLMGESLQQDLAAEIQQVKQKTQDLRQQLSHMQTLTKKRLLHITLQSNQASKKLQATVAKAQTVLRVAKLCHQLENQQRLSWVCLQELDAPQGEPSEFPELEQLLRRFNSAVLQREALRKLKGELGQENQALTLLLRQRLDAAGAAAGAPPLYTVTPAPIATSRQHAVTQRLQDGHVIR